MKNLIDIGFPQFNWLVTSRIWKRHQENVHILKSYMVVQIITKFRNISYSWPKKWKKRFKSPPTIELNM